MEVPSVRKRQCMIKCMRKGDNPDRNREGWEEDSESRRRKQQTEVRSLGGRSWFLEEETGASEAYKMGRKGAGQLFKVND